MKIAALWLILSIPIGGGSVTLDFSVHGALPIPNARAFSTPIGYVYNPEWPEQELVIHREELLHIAQWEALGPFFLPAYILAPQSFEPYTVGQEDWKDGYDYSRMWKADEKRYPQVRITFGEGIEFFPGWRVE